MSFFLTTEFIIIVVAAAVVVVLLIVAYLLQNPNRANACLSLVNSVGGIIRGVRVPRRDDGEDGRARETPSTRYWTRRNAFKRNRRTP